MDLQDRHRLISQAIWLRNNSHSISKLVVFDHVKELDEFGALSVRQIAKLIDSRISRSTLGQYLPPRIRSGGRLNPKSLEDIMQCLSDKENNLLDVRVIKRILLAGTSQNTLSRLTGINQSFISKNAKI
jgi:hypothetical protein